MNHECHYTPSNGYYVCTECGLTLDNKILEMNNENTEPLSPYQLGYRTIIEFYGLKNKTINKIKQGLRLTRLTKYEKNLETALNYLQTMKEIFGINNNQEETIWQSYKQAQKKGACIGSSIERIMLGCVKRITNKTYEELIELTTGLITKLEDYKNRQANKYEITELKQEINKTKRELYLAIKRINFFYKRLVNA